MMRNLPSFLLAAALLAPLPAVAATPADALVVAKNIDDIVSLDPAQAYEFTSGEIVTNTYDRLVQYEAEDMQKLVGGLAESWAVSDDGNTLTFKLRPGVTFQSGNPVRPEDVVFSLARTVKLNKAPAFVLTQLGWTPDNVGQMVRKTGDAEVTITTSGGFAPSFVLNILASRPASVVDEKTVTEHAKDGDLGNAWLGQNSAGTGPFALRSYKPNESIALRANPAYFRGAPAMKSVIYRHVAEPATQRLLLEAGDADMARDLTPDQVAALEGKDGIAIGTYPQAAVHFFSLNQKVAALQNPKVWEAVRYLVDYDGMTKSFLRGQMKIHQAFWPEGFPGALNDTPYTLDVAKAKALLAEAGVKDGLTIKMDVISSPPFTEIAQSLQSTFAKAGITLELVPGTGSQVITKYRARNHEAVLLYWGPDFMDPHSNAGAFAYNVDNADGSPQSTTTWRNSWLVPELSAETDAALKERDAAERDAMYVDLQRKVQASSPIVIMFQAVAQVAMAKSVQGYVNGATTDQIYYRLVTKK